jgi:hypothetical protein
MISKSFTAADQYSEVLFIPRGRILGISISGTFTATVALQRLPAEDNFGYPIPTSTGFLDYASKTAAYEDSLADLAPGWYRLKCTAYTSGTAVCKIW